VQFTWDERKGDASFRARGFDFAFATLVFAGPILVAEDMRREYGERRFVAVGVADGIHLAVVYTDRTDSDGDVVRRIISARRASRGERRIYEQTFSQE
jgi:hypothetical protein